MTAAMVLLPVFVLVGLSFVLLVWMAALRTRAISSRTVKMRDIALRQPNWPEQTTQISNCFANQLELPVLFYVLVALALPLRHADLVFVILSWLFVASRIVHAYIFATTNNVRQRGPAWGVGALILAIMWLYFAIRILLGL